MPALSPRDAGLGAGTVAVTVMLLGPTAFIGVILSLASARTLVATAAVMGAGPLLYAALHLARKYQVRHVPLNQPTRTNRVVHSSTCCKVENGVPRHSAARTTAQSAPRWAHQDSAESKRKSPSHSHCLAVSHALTACVAGWGGGGHAVV